MTAINFPAAPATGATHTEAGITWTFDGTTWDTTGVGYVAKGGDTMTGNLTVPSLNGGQLAGFRNILINGNLKINQRGVTIAAAAVGAYGPDRWKKVDAGNMTQIIEDGNFVPGATYTLSGTGVTTQQLTAPATGNWTLPNIPITASNVQLEQGTVATPFERRPIGLELMLCQRYFEVISGQRFPVGTVYNNANGNVLVREQYLIQKRATPTVILSGQAHFFAAASTGGSEVWTNAAAAVSPSPNIKDCAYTVRLPGPAAAAYQAVCAYSENVAISAEF
jgi:hypothetical protein